MEEEFGNYFLNEETGVFEAYDQHESEAEQNLDVLSNNTLQFIKN